MYKPVTNTIKYITIQLDIKPPAGTLPIIIIIPARRSKEASKFLALNARKEAEATKNANKANMVADKGENIYLNIHWNKLPFFCT